jgi:cyclophilin family peptidyl-prolyl cis-trans isomerase
MSEAAIINTTEGEMVAEFWPDVAPKTRRKFQDARPKGILRRHLLFTASSRVL